MPWCSPACCSPPAPSVTASAARGLLVGLGRVRRRRHRQRLRRLGRGRHRGPCVQGIGAALVMPATLSLITAIFPPEERQRAIAIWVGFAGAGGALGPIVSGALLERFWWGSAFLVNVPDRRLTAVAIALYSPSRGRRGDAARPAWRRAVARRPGGVAVRHHRRAGAGWTSRSWSPRSWRPPASSSLRPLGAVAAHPMLPLSFFADRRFSVGSASSRRRSS